MSQQQGIVKGDALQRLGSLGFIVGAVLLIVFNFLLPRAADPGNLQDLLTTLGNKVGLTQLAGLFIVVGSWAIMIGAAGIYRSITAAGAAWARLGFYGIIVGTTLNTIAIGLHVAEANVGADWLMATASDKVMAYYTGSAIVTVGKSVVTMYVLVEWMAIFFLGIGMARSAIYPKWQGWVALILGALNVAIVGLPQFFAGMTGTLQILFAVLATLTTIWALIVGIWVARRAW